MKRYLIIAVVLACLAFTPAYAAHRSRKSRPQAQTPAPNIYTDPAISIQWGAFTGNAEPLGQWQAFFVGDGDSFSQDAQGFTEPLVVYWESNLTASQIASGQADPFLKQWAIQMQSYPREVIFDVLDEMNGSWSAYSGDPAEYIAAYRHVRSFFPASSNIKFAYDPNVAFPGVPTSSFLSYYPGSAYVDVVGLDGFNFGGQTFPQVFGQSLSAMQNFGKPLWIFSTGSVAPQAQFVSDLVSEAPGYGVQGFIWFDWQQFSLSTGVSL
jgi:hypothetical protein